MSKRIKGMKEVAGMLKKVKGYDGEHVEVVYSPDTREVYGFEVVDGNWIEQNEDEWNVSGKNIETIRKNIADVDEYLEEYKDKMNFETYLMTK